MEEDPGLNSTLSDDGAVTEPGIGHTVGRFVIEGVLGRGGMGVVFAARDPHLGRRVALKILRARPDATSSQRLLREAQVMARLMHPNVAVVFDAGVAGDRVFVAMELVEGRSLDRWLGSGGHRWRDALDRFIRAGRGLSAAHAAGIVHRDFKPANVLLGDDGRVRVSDFGLARSEGDPSERSTGGESANELTETGAVLGTPAYMAPEQARGERASALADQYSFCVALHEGLFGVRPQNAVATARSPVPAPIRRAIARGLAERPENRWPTMDALLDRLVAGSRRRTLWAGAGGVVGAALAAAYLAHSVARPSPCAGVATRLAGVWDPDRKAAIHRAFVATGLPYAEARWRTVEALTDRYATAWVAQASAVCRERQQAPIEAARRQACLDQRLDSLRAWAGVFASVTPPAVRNAVAAAAAHPDLGACRDPVPDARPLPSEPVLAAEVRSLRQQLEAVRTRFNTGEIRRADRELAPLLAAARAVGYKPLMAEMDALAYDVASDLGSDDQLDRLATETAQLAEETRDDAVLAAAWAARVGVLARQRRFTDAHQAARYADAVLAPMSGRRAEQTRIGLLSAEASAYEAEDDFAQAAMLTNAAVARSQRLLGRDDIRNARRIFSLAYDLDGLGRRAEAERLYLRTLDLIRKTSGEHNAMVPMIEANLANLHVLEHDYAGALALQQRAQTHLEEMYGATHPYAGVNLVDLGDTLLHLGRSAEARAALERARPILEPRLAPNAEERANLYAALGWALLDTGAREPAVAVLEKALAIRLANHASAESIAEVRGRLARARAAKR